MRTPDSITCTRAAGSPKPPAERTPGASSTTSTPPTLHRLLPKPSSARSAAVRRSSANRSGKRKPLRCSPACAAGWKTHSRNSPRSPTPRPSATRSRAGVPSRAMPTMELWRSTTTPPNARCASSLSAARLPLRRVRRRRRAGRGHLFAAGLGQSQRARPGAPPTASAQPHRRPPGQPHASDAALEHLNRKRCDQSLLSVHINLCGHLTPMLTHPLSLLYHGQDNLSPLNEVGRCAAQRRWRDVRGGPRPATGGKH